MAKKKKKKASDNRDKPLGIVVYQKPPKDENTRRREHTEHNKRKVLKYLKESLGIVTVACEKANVGRTQFYEWIKSDKEFEAAVADISDIALDFVENKLLDAISAVGTPGAVTGMIFYLKCKGKKRGYLERIEIAKVNPDKDLEDMTDDELAEEEKRLEAIKEEIEPEIIVPVKEEDFEAVPIKEDFESES